MGAFGERCAARTWLAAMGMTILSVAYPFARVAPDTPGGAEQILLLLDRKLARDGHRSLVAARQDSQVTGTLIPMPSDDGPIDAAARPVCAPDVRSRCASSWPARESTSFICMASISIPICRQKALRFSSPSICRSHGMTGKLFVLLARTRILSACQRVSTRMPPGCQIFIRPSRTELTSRLTQ